MRKNVTYRKNTFLEKVIGMSNVKQVDVGTSWDFCRSSCCPAAEITPGTLVACLACEVKARLRWPRKDAGGRGAGVKALGGGAVQEESTRENNMCNRVYGFNFVGINIYFPAKGEESWFSCKR